MAKCACGGEFEGGWKSKAGLCRTCHMRTLGRSRRQYVFTDELRAELRAAYCLRRPAQKRAIDELVRKTGWRRGAFTDEATRMGIARPWQKWSAAEDQWLRERAGKVALGYMAKKLHRSERAIEQRLHVLKVSRLEQREGYTLSMLSVMFGVRIGKVNSWLDRGLMRGKRVGCGTRVQDEDVARFIRKHPHEYDLRRVDQTWYKAMLFGAAGAGEAA